MTRFQERWEQWVNSKEGRTCLDASAPLRADILENRLFAAFAAGYILSIPKLARVRRRDNRLAGDRRRVRR